MIHPRTWLLRQYYPHQIRDPWAAPARTYIAIHNQRRVFMIPIGVLALLENSNGRRKKSSPGSKAWYSARSRREMQDGSHREQISSTGLKSMVLNQRTIKGWYHQNTQSLKGVLWVVSSRFGSASNYHEIRTRSSFSCSLHKDLEEGFHIIRFLHSSNCLKLLWSFFEV